MSNNARNRNALIVEARKDGKTIAFNSIPTNAPKGLHDFVGQCLGAYSVAIQRKQHVAVCVAPRWKIWIVHNILRITK